MRIPRTSHRPQVLSSVLWAVSTMTGLWMLMGPAAFWIGPWLALTVELVEMNLGRARARPQNCAHASSAEGASPLGAEYLLYLFVPPEQRDPVLGDLEERFQELLAKFGHRRATIWCYVEVGKSLPPVIAGVVRRLVNWGRGIAP